MSYTVVHFKEENSVEGVPSSWIINVNNKVCCYWPPKNVAGGITSLIKRCASADLSWSLAKCSIIFKASSYSDMREKCKEAAYLTGSENTEREESIVTEESDFESDSSEEMFPSPPSKKMKVSNCNKTVIGKKNSDITNQPISKSANQPISEMNNLIMELVNKVKTIESQNTKILSANSEIFKNLVDTKEEVQVLKRMIRKNISSSVVIDHSSKLPNLPIHSISGLNNLESILQDESERQNLTMKLSNFGGSQLRGTVNNIMKNAISHSVSALYSMQGKGTKLSFMELKLCSCIQGEYNF